MVIQRLTIMRFLPFTLQKALFCKVKGKKLQAKGFISSVTVDLSYSKSAKKKVLRRDTKKVYFMRSF
jgi:hypothetical protein